MIDLTEQERNALTQSASGESLSDPDALVSALEKLTPSEPVEEAFGDQYGKQDGETIPGGGYDVELVVEGSTEPDPVSPEENL